MHLEQPEHIRHLLPNDHRVRDREKPDREYFLRNIHEDSPSEKVPD
jgi:hypothetical protein